VHPETSIKTAHCHANTWKKDSYTIALRVAHPDENEERANKKESSSRSSASTALAAGMKTEEMQAATLLSYDAIVAT